MLDNKRVKIYSSRIGNSDKKAKVGQIINIYEDGLGVKTKDGEIIITELQFEGKKRSSVKEYLNGVQNKNDLLLKRFL